MIRIAGVVIPDYKHANIALTQVYGIGIHTAQRICNQASVDITQPVGSLPVDKVDLLRKLVQNENIEGDLRREVQINIKRLIDIGSYRGLRHRKRLPVRGQRTRTNARTRKGRRQFKVISRDRGKQTR